jgi:hypothetical protein
MPHTRFCAEGGLFSDDKPKSSPDVPKEIYPNNYRHCRERLLGARAKPAELLR